MNKTSKPRIVRSAPDGKGPHADLTDRPGIPDLIADRVSAVAVIILSACICRLAYIG